MKISSAGNVEVPSYLVLIEKGYAVRREMMEHPEELWIATKAELKFSAQSPIELLGVVCLYETRGADWQASDKAIEEFVRDFNYET